jgi:hypothetical protein
MAIEHAPIHALALVKSLIEAGHYKNQPTSLMVDDLHTLTAAITDLDKPQN